MPVNLTSNSLPWARYKASTGKLAFGIPGGEIGEIGLAGLQLAVDVENSIPGWLRVADGGADFLPGIHNQPPPIAPTADHHWTMSVPVWSPKALGDTIYHICDLSWAYKMFVQKISNSCESDFGRNQIPLVKVIDTPAIQTAKGTSFQISFILEKWIDRPKDFIQAVALRDASIAVKQAKSVANYATSSGRGPDYGSAVANSDPGDPPPNDAPPMTEEEIKSFMRF